MQHILFFFLYTLNFHRKISKCREVFHAFRWFEFRKEKGRVHHFQLSTRFHSSRSHKQNVYDNATHNMHWHTMRHRLTHNSENQNAIDHHTVIT